MTARSSSRLVGGLAVLIVGLLAWLVISLSGRKGATVPHHDTVIANSESEKPGNAQLATPDEDSSPKTESARAIAERVAVGDEGPTSAELKDAVWIGGRVIFPDRTPGDEIATVVAVGREFGSKRLHRAPVAADGTFKVAFAPSTKKATLRLDARYVFLEESKTVKLGESNADVVLAPSLGGGLRGRVKVDASSQRFASELVGATVSIWGWKQGLSNTRTKSSKLDKDLAFEIGGLDPAIGWHVSCAAKGFATAAVESVSVSAARFETLELTIARGSSVSGTVRDEHGKPVTGAHLHTDARASGVSRDLLDDPVSDKDGRFAFADLRSGEAHIVVAAKGFVVHTLEPLQLAAGEERANVDVTLSRGLSIAGSARFSDGLPATDVTITAAPNEEQPTPHGIWFNRQDPSTKTDSEGKFTLPGLVAGKHMVSARSALKDAEKVPSGAKRAPRVRFEDRRKDVAAGTTDLVLTLESGTPLLGRVVDDLGAPVPAFGISVSRSGENPWERSGRREHLSKAKDGTFEIPGLADGSWVIQAMTKDGGASPELVVKIPEEVRPLELIVPRPSKLRGTVLDPSGTPVAGASLRIDRSDDMYRYWSNDAKAEKSDELGAFEMTARPGSIKLSAAHSNWASSEKVEVEVLPASATGPHTLRLRLGGTITGRVLDRAGQAEAGRNVNLWANEDSQHRASDAEGRFRFERVAPGEAQVSIQPTGAELAVTRDAQGEVDWQLAQPMNGTARVDVVDGQVVDVVLGGIPMDALKVTGLVRAGAPLSGVKLQFYGPLNAKEADSRATISDAAGRYEVLLAKPGSYSVSLERADNTRVNLRVEIPAGPSFVYDITLPAGSIQGRVLDAQGAPVAGVDVSASARSGGANPDGTEVHFGSVKTRDDGTFALSALSPATYDITAQHAGGFVGNTWRSSLAQATVRGVVLAEGATVDGVVLRFPLNGSVKGSVRNAAGAIVAGSFVTARPIDAKSEDGFYIGAQSGPDGSFLLEGLATGTYTLIAAKKHEIGESDSTVTVNEGATSEMNLTLRPGNTLVVQCEDSEGKLVKVRIDLRDSRGRNCPYASFVDSEEASTPKPDLGRRFAPLPDGEYVVSAKLKSKDPVEQRVSLKGGVTREVRLRLSE